MGRPIQNVSMAVPTSPIKEKPIVEETEIIEV